jgi:Uncharacterized conserved protein (DUF2190)
MVTGNCIPKKATAAIKALRLLKATATHATATHATAVTDSIIGVSKAGAAINAHFDVQIDGIAYVEAGAAVAVGADVTCDSVGRGITASPAVGVNNYIAGKTLTAASAVGDVFEVELALSRIQG